MKLFDRTIFLINFGVILATFLAYLAPNIDPELTWTIAFFGLFYPVLLIINVLFIVYWLFKKPKYSIASILCIILGWNQVKGFISFIQFLHSFQNSLSLTIQNDSIFVKSNRVLNFQMAENSRVKFVRLTVWLGYRCECVPNRFFSEQNNEHHIYLSGAILIYIQHTK